MAIFELILDHPYEHEIGTKFAILEKSKNTVCVLKFSQNLSPPKVVSILYGPYNNRPFRSNLCAVSAIKSYLKNFPTY